MSTRRFPKLEEDHSRRGPPPEETARREGNNEVDCGPNRLRVGWSRPGGKHAESQQQTPREGGVRNIYLPETLFSNKTHAPFLHLQISKSVGTGKKSMVKPAAFRSICGKMGKKGDTSSRESGEGPGGMNQE